MTLLHELMSWALRGAKLNAGRNFYRLPWRINCHKASPSRAPILVADAGFVPTKRYGQAAFLSLLLCLIGAMPIYGEDARVIEEEGKVTVKRRGSGTEDAILNMSLITNDLLRTRALSRAVIRMSPTWFARVDERSDIEILQGAIRNESEDAFNLLVGSALIYSREESGELKVQTPAVTGDPHGTEMIVTVDRYGKTVMKVLEGSVTMRNEKGQLMLSAGESGEADPGEAPHLTAVIETRNLIQWALYYPAVLIPSDIGLTDSERRTLALSLQKYQEGDLLAALRLYPTGAGVTSDAVNLYHAAVLLAVGRVDEARLALGDLPANSHARRAIERMLAAILAVEQPGEYRSTTASEALAESYYQQSRRNLTGARAAAKKAKELAPESGFPWIRLADLEFSFGETHRAIDALQQGLKRAPFNPEGLSLQGYLLSAENKIQAARDSFRRALKIDGALGNAWLGLGLTDIRQGDRKDGLSEIQTAVTVEPTRAFFYSYHGRALSSNDQIESARRDLKLALAMDSMDPTPYLFMALNEGKDYKFNEAVDDLGKSVEKNENRLLYRSKFLIEQDEAVRSANLAVIYQDDGMNDLALREATRAVDEDFLNASAHLFLSNAYDALRDPQRISLRYEDAWFNERLLANLLAPVGGGSLSQFVSQQEYSKLLESDGYGGNLVSEWRNGYTDQLLSLDLVRGKMETSLDVHYDKDNGYRPDNGSELTEAYWNFKYQVSSDDTFYTMVQAQWQRSADTAQTYSNLPGNPGESYRDKQLPGLLLLGWNHIWGPGVRTLLLGGRLSASDTLTEPDTKQALLVRDHSYLQPGFIEAASNGSEIYTSPALENVAAPGAVYNSPSGPAVFSQAFLGAIAPYLDNGPVTQVANNSFDYATSTRFNIYSFELEHIWQTDRNTLLGGIRWQDGIIEASAELTLVDPLSNTPIYSSPASAQSVSPDFNRQSVYVYDFFAATPWLTLIAGASWDSVERPDDFRNPPLSDLERRDERRNGKFGFTISPSKWITVRGAYTEALGGVSFDDDVQLEPVQFAGFNQDFRTVISESIVGSVEAPVYHNRGLSIEGWLPSQTWWASSIDVLNESVQRMIGVFDVFEDPIFPLGAVVLPAGTEEDLDYREEVFTAGINQLVGRQIALGASYKATRAELRDDYPQIPVSVDAGAYGSSDDLLRELHFNINWNSATGWFVNADAAHYAQELNGPNGGQATAASTGDSFWQFNGQVGRRFSHNLRQLSAGVLDLSNRNYNLSPLTYYPPNLPHARTFFVRLRIGF